jgi:exosortase N
MGIITIIDTQCLVGMATKNNPLIWLAADGALLLWWLISGYLVVDASLVAGLMLLPLLLVFRGQGGNSWRFAVWSVVCIAVSLILPARTLHFFTLGFAALFLLENWRGRVGWQPVAALILMSSLMTNWITVFGFPIRLFLSQQAAAGLAFTGFAAHSAGNMIILRGQEFAVDPACMGLTMVQVSYLFLLALTAVHERDNHSALPFWLGAVLVAVTGFLVLIFNLLRIVLLCLFGWMPGTFLHEAGGLIGLVVYVFLPLWWIVRFFHHKFAQPMATVTATIHHRLSLKIISAHTFLLLAVGGAFFTGDQAPRENWAVLQPSFDTTGMVRTAQQHGVIQYYGNELLIYSKPIIGFYSSEHSPLVCWVGSGFQLKESDEMTLPNGFSVYTGTLENDKGEKLYTSWWYDNGQHRTTSQLKWRQRDAMGEPPFFLVNVTASGRDTLMSWLTLHSK